MSVLGYGRGVKRSAGRPRSETKYEPPTDAERRDGAVFDCPGCERDWSLRLKHPREQLCLPCGRELGRERKHAQRARVDQEDVPVARPPRRTKTEPIAGKKTEVAEFVRAPEPEQLSEVDRIVRRATRQKKPKSPGRGIARR